MKIAKGFTLIEVLVALVLVSIMSLLAWRGLDGMGRAVSLTASHEQGAQRLGVTLAQWTADLDALSDTGQVKALDFDGQLLRLTRRSHEPSGIAVVAWVIRSGRLLRYASPALQNKNELQAAWLNAARWARTPLPEDSSRTVDLMAANSWQIFYYRGGAWTNPQSSAGEAIGAAPAPPAPTSPSPSATETQPDGVRLILDLPPGAGLAGKITRDWLQPALGATR